MHIAFKTYTHLIKFNILKYTYINVYAPVVLYVSAFLNGRTVYNVPIDILYYYIVIVKLG